jgi:hypothetical protein
MVNHALHEPDVGIRRLDFGQVVRLRRRDDLARLARRARLDDGRLRSRRPGRFATGCKRKAYRKRKADRVCESGHRPQSVTLTLPRSAVKPTAAVPLSKRGRAVRQVREGERHMRVMVLVKANKDSEAGVLPDKKILTEMGAFNEKRSKAGVMLAGEGLKPTSAAKRVRFSGSERTVIDGPFAETKELIAGFWLWKVKSMEDAVAWLKQAPFGGGTEIEIRPLFEAGEITSDMAEELRAKEERLRADLDRE